MQHTPTPDQQVKISALELIDFVEIETLQSILKFAFTTKEGKEWDHIEKSRLINCVHYSCAFLNDLKTVNEINLSFHKVKISIDYVEEARLFPDAEFLKITNKMFSELTAKQMSWDIMTLFVAAIDSQYYRANNFELTNAGFSVKLFTQFLRDIGFALSV